MWVRAAAVLVVVVVFAYVQVVDSVASGPRAGAPFAAFSRTFHRGAAAQGDDNANDNGTDEDTDGDNLFGDDDDDADNDDGDGDNTGGDDDGDNGDGDDGDDDDNDNGSGDDSDDDDDDNGNDNGDDEDVDNENSDAGGIEVVSVPSVQDGTPTPRPTPVTPTPTPRPTRTPTPTPEPTTDAEAVTTGGDLELTLSGDRVVLKVFATTPGGIRLTLRLVDPSTQPPTPGQLAGDLMFQVEATDATGAPLTTLPAEVSLSVRYADDDVAALDEAAITLSRLDPGDGQWKAIPSLLADPDSNFLAGSIVDIGVFAVHAH